MTVGEDHFEANVIRSAATFIERRRKRKTFTLDVMLRTMRSIADDIDPGCPEGTCGRHSDGTDPHA